MQHLNSEVLLVKLRSRCFAGDFERFSTDLCDSDNSIMAWRVLRHNEKLNKYSRTPICKIIVFFNVIRCCLILSIDITGGTFQIFH